METMRKADFDHLMTSDYSAYYAGRWDYYKHVIDIVHGSDPASVLELGPGRRTIVNDCDIMVVPNDDAWGRPINKVNETYIHDATETPWPIADKKYEMFIALQVWEHLGNKQCSAFREVMRIAKSAVLSFPYKWDCPKDNPNYPEHHRIDEQLIADWTVNVKPQMSMIVDRTGDKVSKGPRILYYWVF